MMCVPIETSITRWRHNWPMHVPSSVDGSIRRGKVLVEENIFENHVWRSDFNRLCLYFTAIWWNSEKNNSRKDIFPINFRNKFTVSSPVSILHFRLFDEYEIRWETCLRAFETPLVFKRPRKHKFNQIQKENYFNFFTERFFYSAI